MQEHISACKIVSSFFENSNVASIAHSYMTLQFYVLNFTNCWKTPNIICLGLFASETKAIRAIFDFLLKNRHVYYNEDAIDDDEPIYKPEFDNDIKTANSMAEIDKICQIWGYHFPDKWNFNIELKEFLN